MGSRVNSAKCRAIIIRIKNKSIPVTNKEFKEGAIK
jgi:hypothetical protein